MFKFEGGQTLWLKDGDHKVTVCGRTEFFNGKQPRYYIQSETALPGKPTGEDWVNEDKLTDVEPVAPVIDEPVEAEDETVNVAKPTTKGKKHPGGIRKHGLGGA